LAEVVNGLSVDVEEYFHAVNLRPAFPEADWRTLAWRAEIGVGKALRILERSGQKATFFVLGWVAEHEPELVRSIASAGHEIASHGHSHRMVDELGPDGFAADVAKSLELLARLSPAPVEGFRASTFSVTEKTWWALEVLARLGLRYDSSIFPVRHDRYGMPRFARTPVELAVGERRIVELPLLTWRLFGQNLPAAGGGYLRQFPLRYTQMALRAMNRAGHPGVLYLHPWELDPDQPRAAARLIGRLGHLRHYRNLERTAERLERLVAEFRFAPLRELVGGAAPLRSVA
jgi:polysaccharide deacetylase family protein (PEP-CTERM system associated)